MNPPVHRRNSGVSILMTLFLVILLIIFIGGILHVILRAANRIPRRSLPEEEQSFVNESVAQESEEAQQANPGAAVSVPYVNLQKGFVPSFSAPAEFRVRLERSTNLLDWELLGEIGANERLVDTNPPPDRAFYRRTVFQ